jgi:hypothetical protein
MESFFLHATEKLRALSECLQTHQFSSANSELDKIYTSAMQIGFSKLALQVRELKRLMDEHPGKSAPAKSQLLFVKCELQVLETRWDAFMRTHNSSPVSKARPSTH